MKFIKLSLQDMVNGVFIGFTIALFFSWIYGASTFMPSSPEFTKHFHSNLIATTASMGLWALMGLVFSIGQYIFRQDNWSITKQTVVHFLVTYVCFTILACLAGWFPINIVHLASYSLIFVLVYLIIWIIAMHSARRNVAELNQTILK